MKEIPFYLPKGMMVWISGLQRGISRIRLLLGYFVFLCLSAASSWAQTQGEWNGLRYEENAAEVAIVGYTAALPSAVEIPETINGKPVRRIGNYAFSSSNATSITLSNSVTTIGEFAFNNCRNVTVVTISASVSTIGRRAFQECPNLAQINVDAANSAFASENGVLFNKQKTTLIRYPQAKSGAYTIPSTVEFITEGAFYECTNLTGVTIPSSVSVIGVGAFWKCTGLTQVTIPGSVINLETDAFGECTGLTNLSLQDGIHHIKFGAFRGCTGLTRVHIPRVNFLDGGAFAYCSNLVEFTTATENPSFSTQDGVLFNKNKTTLMAYPAGKSGNYTIPSTVTGISAGAFQGAVGLTGVRIPSGVEKILDSTFEDCTNLASVNFEYGLYVISQFAFRNNRKLREVVLPRTLVTLGMEAFAGCSELQRVEFLGDAPQNVGLRVFDGAAADFKIYYRGSGFTTPTWNGYPAFPATGPTPTPSPTVSPSPTPAASIMIFGNGSVTPRLTSLVLNRSYTLTATPRAGSIFQQWRSGNATVGRTPRYTFTYTGQPVELEAVFIENPYPTLAGVYNGLFLPEGGGMPEGPEVLTLTAFGSVSVTGTGAFTGTLLHNGGRLSLRGQLDGFGEAQVNIPRRVGGNLTLALSLGLGGEDYGVLSGNLTVPGVGVLRLMSKGSAYTGRAGSVHPLSGARFHAALEPAGGSWGFGYLVAVVNGQGQAALSGKLPDGVVLTQGLRLVPHGGSNSTESWKVDVYVPLYRGAGLLGGEGSISGSAGQEDWGGAWQWYRPAGQGGLAGFSGAVDVLSKGRYVPPGRGVSWLSGSATAKKFLVKLEGGGLEEALIANGTWMASNTLSMDSGMARGWSVRFAPATGLLTGTAPALMDGRAILLRFEGVALSPDPDSWEGPVRGAGFFLNAGQSGAMLLAPTD